MRKSSRGIETFVSHLNPSSHVKRPPTSLTSHSSLVEKCQPLKNNIRIMKVSLCTFTLILTVILSQITLQRPGVYEISLWGAETRRSAVQIAIYYRLHRPGGVKSPYPPLHHRPNGVFPVTNSNPSRISFPWEPNGFAMVAPPHHGSSPTEQQSL